MKEFLKTYLTHALTTQESKIEFWQACVDVSYGASADSYEELRLSSFIDPTMLDDEDNTFDTELCLLKFRQKNDATGETHTRHITIPLSDAIELVEFIVNIQSDMNDKELEDAPAFKKKASSALDDFILNSGKEFKIEPRDVIEIQNTTGYKDCRGIKTHIRFSASRGEEKLTLMAEATDLLNSNWLGSCKFIFSYTDGKENLSQQHLEIPFFLFTKSTSLKEFAPKPCKSQAIQEKEFIDFLIDKSSVANYVHLNEQLNSNNTNHKRVKI